MEKTKNGKLGKALMMGTAMVSLNAIAMVEAEAASGTGPMSAVVLQPINVAGTQVMQFGTFTISGASDTITVNPGGGGTAGANISLVASSPALAPATISISAATGVNIQLSMAAATYTVDLTTAATDPMNVNNFLFQHATPAATVVTTLGAATETRLLGATLNVALGQTPGTYQGAYTVNANYQ
jgi:hypothetical protein